MIIWVLSTVPMLFLALVLAFAAALRRCGSRGFYRVAYFVPNITSMVAMAIVFGSVFATSFGLLNAVLQWLGAGEDRLADQPLGDQDLHRQRW